MQAGAAWSQSNTAFDAIGRVMTATQTVNGASYTFGVTYKPQIGIQSITYPTSNRVVTTLYDSAGRPATLSGQIGTATATPYVTATALSTGWRNLHADSSEWQAGFDEYRERAAAAEWDHGEGRNWEPAAGVGVQLQSEQRRHKEQWELVATDDLALSGGDVDADVRLHGAWRRGGESPDERCGDRNGELEPGIPVRRGGEPVGAYEFRIEHYARDGG